MKNNPKETIDNIRENYMIGTLVAENDKKIPSLGKERKPVTTMGNKEVIFYIKALSPEPEPITQIEEETQSHFKYYIGYLSEITTDNIDHNHLNIDEKADTLNKELSGKLVLFKPLLSQEKRAEGHEKNIEWLKVLDEEYVEGTEYIPIPIFDLKHEEFERLLLSNETIELGQYTNAMPFPLYLYCDNYIYGNIRDDNWREDAEGNRSYMLLKPGKIKRVELVDAEYHKFSVSNLDHLVFFHDEYLSDVIDSSLEEKGVSLAEIKSKIELEEEMAANVVDFQPTKSYINERADLPEVDFIDYLEALAISKNLFYSREDIVNFHVSIKSSAFTILSGQSGIGKTQLAILYAEALGLNQSEKDLEAKEFLILPISPAYTEPADILGFLNPNTGLYTPADTGLVDFLISASKNKDKIHMLILDEMNLSQIEHYFSPFLSLLELDEDKRILPLYNEGDTCHNSMKYKHEIKLGNNLIIVGTMNTDETTKGLSDRLLDRSSIVELSKQPFTKIRKKLMNKNEAEEVLDELTSGTGIAYGETYLNWINDDEYWEIFKEEELILFEKVDRTISERDQQKGFSIRNLMRMGQYLSNIPKDQEGVPEINRQLAIDLFIKQRVITKLRGPIDIYKSLIGTTFDNTEETGELVQLFKEAEEISDFTHTLEELRKKSEELNNHGYIF